MRQTLWIVGYLAMCLGLMISPISAQENDVDQREQPVQELFQTDLVYAQERGELQLSHTSRFSKGKDRSLLKNLLTVEYGITNRWQIEIEWNAINRRSETGEATARGRGDLSIGTQYSFMNMARSNFHSAVGFEITLPTANIEKEMTEGFVEYEPYFILAKDFPKLNNLQLFSQVGIGFKQRARRHADANDDEPAAHEANLGVGMFIPFRRVVFTGEFNFSTNRWNNGGREREVFATPGSVWKLPRNWQLGLGVPIGLTRDSDRFGTVVTLVYEFNLLRGSR